MICPRCNNNIPEGLKFCSECGAPLINQIEPQGTPTPQQYPSQQYRQGPSGDDYASTSLRFGIVGTCMDLTVFLSVVGLILGIVGIKKAGNASRMGVKTGKQKAGLILSIISLVLSIAIPFIFFTSCYARAKKNLSSETSITASDNIATKIEGTYVGSNGSLLVMKKNNTSYYYYPGYGISTNMWTIKDNKVEMFISNCLCNVYANIDPNNTDTIYLESDSLLWDAETFTKVSSDSEKPTESQCDSILNEHSSLVINKPETNTTTATTVATTAETKSTTATTSQADTSSDSQSTTVNDMTVKEALDTYEEYMDKYIALYQGMMDGSLDYFEALNEINELQGDIDDLESALNSLSESDMTPEEYKYYIEVMTRVSEKVLSMYGN